MNKSRRMTRRNALALGIAATALPLVHIRTAGAAGKLSVGFWDHWIPKANDTMTRQVNAWAEQNKVDVSIDYITSNGFKIQVTQAAEAQAKTGHDFLPFYNWEVNTYANQLEPVDDLVTQMIGQYGKYIVAIASANKGGRDDQTVPAGGIRRGGGPGCDGSGAGAGERGQNRGSDRHVEPLC
jgi:spermidine/putrescine-binding protein